MFLLLTLSGIKFSSSSLSSSIRKQFNSILIGLSGSDGDSEVGICLTTLLDVVLVSVSGISGIGYKNSKSDWSMVGALVIVIFGPCILLLVVIWIMKSWLIRSAKYYLLMFLQWSLGSTSIFFYWLIVCNLLNCMEIFFAFMENVEAIDEMVHLALISSIHWGKNEVVGKKKKLCVYILQKIKICWNFWSISLKLFIK